MSPVPPSPSGQRPIRVLVVGGRAPARAHLRGMLEGARDLRVVGEAEDADGCRQLCAAAAPDVVLGELGDPRTRGADLVRDLTHRHPPVQVLVVTTSCDGDDMRSVLDAGAVGYLLADVDPATVRDGVRSVVRGHSPLDPRAVRAMLRTRPSVRAEDLTAREREVLALVVRGLSNREIARELGICDSTVKAHLGSVFARIGVADRASAARWAERHLSADVGPPPGGGTPTTLPDRRHRARRALPGVGTAQPASA